MTRGERNNNPCNIRHVAGVIWKGQSAVQTDDAFVQFDDVIYGFRAPARILASYDREGLQTLAEVIDRWAPPNENNSAAYVADVCSRCSVDADAPIDIMAMRPQIIEAIVWHENSENIYTEDQIRQGISLI
jgi:hypothetical protein